ncbi:methyltransferase domain-containing protein (plasmid) [Pseudomonas yamanorum]|nr:methyltransferase domain-containing protein [Pseudomonas yamanorum]
MRKLYMLGAGHMGGAILLGLTKHMGSPESLCIIEQDERRRQEWLARGYHAASHISRIENQDSVVFAIPPQQFEQALADNPALLSHRGPVISVMAGISHATLVRALGHDNIVRSIPNTPSEVEEGMTLFYAPVHAEELLLDEAQRIFNAIGVSLRVFEESQIDTGTALVGGGPALVAYFAEALEDYALKSGFTDEQAAVIAIQLLYGTARLFQVTGKAASTLCKEVQTPGGTTERAINYLANANFKITLGNALRAAAERSSQLGGQVHDVGSTGSASFGQLPNEFERGNFPTYTLYFGMGHSVKLIDDSRVFKVSPAGKAFGDFLAKRFGRQYLNTRFLDVGTGSGVHSLLLRKLGIQDITATDISAEAVQVAQVNELQNLGSQSICFRQCDLFTGIEAGQEFDVILFNPPGWQTPSAAFLEALKTSDGTQGLAIEAMFYGECTLRRFFEQVPHYLKPGGKVIIGLNSLVGIDAVLKEMCEVQDGQYQCDWSLSERHEFPLALYTEQWRALQPLIRQEITQWVNNGLAYCRFTEEGEVMWSYEIIELAFTPRSA